MKDPIFIVIFLAFTGAVWFNMISMLKKYQKGLSGYAAMELFSRYNVLDYLAEHFDVLHTQNSRWILEDIDEFIRTRQSNE